MTAPHADPLIAGYLARLSDAAMELPRGPRAELIDDVRAHIAEARARETGEETDATILNILDRLGEPLVVVAETRDRLGLQAAQPFKPGVMEIAAVVLLPFVWPIGVLLLWISPAWGVRDKIIGTLLPPGGYPGLLILAASHAVAVTGRNGFSPGQQIEIIVLSIVFYTLPVVTAGYLGVRLRWGRRAAPSFP